MSSTINNAHNSNNNNITTTIIPELRIGVGGNVDAGKSSFVGVVTKNVLDNGRGYARSFVMTHQHEKVTGRTSSISQQYIRHDDKIIEFTDLAGHEKYLPTTISGIASSLIDYVAIIINSATGIQQMTREHISLVYAMKLPMFIVYTKIDMCPKNIYEINLDYINTFYNKKMNLDTTIINDSNHLNEFLKTYTHTSRTIPIFPISNVSGQGLDTLRQFIYSLKQYINYNELNNCETNFIMSKHYSVAGIGLVVSGVMKSGTIRKGDVLYIGPNSEGFIRNHKNVIIGESNNQTPNYYKIVIKGIHNNFRETIDILQAGHSGCFNIKPVGKFILKRSMLKKGMRIVSQINSVRQFEAKIKIFHNPSTITKKYQPTVHVGGISQSVQILEMDKEFLRSHDEARVKLKFMYKPEFIEPGSIFVFREGNLKGLGKITNVF